MGLGLYIQYFRLYAKKKKVTKNEQIIKNLVNRNINVKYSTVKESQTASIKFVLAV